MYTGAVVSTSEMLKGVTQIYDNRENFNKRCDVVQCWLFLASGLGEGVYKCEHLKAINPIINGTKMKLTRILTPKDT